MLAFIPLLVPLVPALIGACAGATAVAACHSSEDKDEKIRELKARVDALEKDRKP
jgi:outer membrane murein-binding lipoprotein Lpp